VKRHQPWGLPLALTGPEWAFNGRMALENLPTAPEKLSK
jgi:hypothetical protein